VGRQKCIVGWVCPPGLVAVGGAHPTESHLRALSQFLLRFFLAPRFLEEAGGRTAGIRELSQRNDFHTVSKGVTTIAWVDDHKSIQLQIIQRDAH
jgi:hypothetical protein